METLDSSIVFTLLEEKERLNLGEWAKQWGIENKETKSVIVEMRLIKGEPCPLFELLKTVQIQGKVIIDYLKIIEKLQKTP